MLVEVTKAISGDDTYYLGNRLRGRVHAIKYAPGTCHTNTDLTITGATTGVAILTKANAGTSDVWYYPRAFPNQATDGAAEADATCDIHVFNEQIKVVVADSSAGVGAITVYVDVESGF